MWEFLFSLGFGYLLSLNFQGLFSRSVCGSNVHFICCVLFVADYIPRCKESSRMKIIVDILMFEVELHFRVSMFLNLVAFTLFV